MFRPTLPCEAPARPGLLLLSAYRQAPNQTASRALVPAVMTSRPAGRGQIPGPSQLPRPGGPGRLRDCRPVASKGDQFQKQKAPPKQGQVVSIATCDVRHRLRPLFVLPFGRLENGHSENAHSRRAFG